MISCLIIESAMNYSVYDTETELPGDMTNSLGDQVGNKEPGPCGEQSHVTWVLEALYVKGLKWYFITWSLLCVQASLTCPNFPSLMRPPVRLD